MLNSPPKKRIKIFFYCHHLALVCSDIYFFYSIWRIPRQFISSLELTASFHVSTTSQSRPLALILARWLMMRYDIILIKWNDEIIFQLVKSTHRHTKAERKTHTKNKEKFKCFHEISSSFQILSLFPLFGEKKRRWRLSDKKFISPRAEENCCKSSRMWLVTFFPVKFERKRTTLRGLPHTFQRKLKVNQNFSSVW